MFHIEGARNFLADRGSRLPTGSADNDRGDGAAGDGDSAKVIGAAVAEIQANTACDWPPLHWMQIPRSAYCDQTGAQLALTLASPPTGLFVCSIW